MKVLFNTYPMAFHTPGGGEIQLLAYKKYLAQFGVDVHLFDQWNPNFFDFDLVHFFSCIGGSVHFCRFVKNLGIPLVISSSLWITEKSKHLYPIDEIRDQLLLADCVITNSDIEGETLARLLNLPRQKFTTIYNGVADEFFNPVSPEIFRTHFKIYSPFVLNVGNIEPRKNQLTLVRAMKVFPEKKLVLIGHPRDPEYLKKVISEGGDQIFYIGPIDHENILLRSAYAACDLFCLPSTLETPGLAALEAAAVGVPLVITKEGSAKEYFGDQAEYVDPEDTKEIAYAIQKYFASSIKDQKRRTIEVEHLRWERIVKKLEEVYFSIKSFPDYP